MGKRILFHGTSDAIIRSIFGRGDEKHDLGIGLAVQKVGEA